MQDAFSALSQRLFAGLRGDEMLLLSLSGEESDFVRLSRNRVRQAGSVHQASLHMDLVSGSRHATASAHLTGQPELDLHLFSGLLTRLRAQRTHLPEDPFLNVHQEPWNSDYRQVEPLPSTREMMTELTDRAAGLDLVGIVAAGPVHRGFASSLGHRNWHTSTSFNLDFSCYLNTDNAVKSRLGGRRWDSAALEERLLNVRRELELMARPARTLEPGTYRVYLAPAALSEVMDMLAWGGFGLKSHRTAQTSLLKMVREDRRLDTRVNLAEEHGRGLVPRFGYSGHPLPERVILIEDGAYRDCLGNPRSAREFGTKVNCDVETPMSLDMAGGGLAGNDVLSALDTGLYIGNLWYLNYSDRNDCRITGMTRFTCFQVENGVMRSPINVLRFDDSVYSLLGKHLLDLTRERELLLDSSTYGGRSLASQQLPGALIGAMTFTL